MSRSSESVVATHRIDARLLTDMALGRIYTSGCNRCVAANQIAAVTGNSGSQPARQKPVPNTRRPPQGQAPASHQIVVASTARPTSSTHSDVTQLAPARSPSRSRG